jgi:hypothetical protein
VFTANWGWAHMTAPGTRDKACCEASKRSGVSGGDEVEQAKGLGQGPSALQLKSAAINLRQASRRRYRVTAAAGEPR